jgi:murein DD-endopeptidase MepM/ murein hydrolase activator NlpD
VASLQGRLFFDYNGNGVQDGEEPPVAGALVQLKEEPGNVIAETLTDSSGDYKLEDVRTGAYRLHVGVEQFSDKRLTHMCTSPNGFRAVSDDYVLLIRESTVVDVGLMEGFLTLPLAPNTTYTVGRYYDRDPAVGHVKWWNGKAYNWTNAQGKGADDNHAGTDFDARQEAQVVAPAPGTILSAGVGPNPESLTIDIQHDLGFKTSYNHLSKTLVSAGQRVSRGETIGLVGSTGTFYPHLHFELYQPWSEGPAIFDPYRPTFTVTEEQSGCWALKGREKYWLHLSLDKNPNLMNYWTKENDPQYSV